MARSSIALAVAAPEIRERPILFSGAMVNAILSGQKTMTRRGISIANSLVNGDSPSKRSTGLGGWPDLDFSKAWVDRGPSPAGNPGPYLKVPGGDESVQRVYSRIQTGDRLWVRETWRTGGDSPGSMCTGPESCRYAASVGEAEWAISKWRPSIFMPRWASRITLEVTAVRPERVQEISSADVAAEGVTSHLGAMTVNGEQATGFVSAQYAFACLWNGINGKRSGCTWQDNPWCWVIEFKVVK